MSNLNKWKVIDGKLINVKDGEIASDVIKNSIDKTFDSMEQPIVDSLSAKDAGYIAARRERMASSIDQKRINNSINLLNQEKEHFIDFLMEASRNVEAHQKELEAQVVEVGVVEIKPFEQMLAAKLGGVLTSSNINSHSKELPSSNNEFDEFIK